MLITKEGRISLIENADHKKGGDNNGIKQKQFLKPTFSGRSTRGSRSNEIAQEFGVNLGAETTSRANGSVGGEITKRLVSMAQQQLSGQNF